MKYCFFIITLFVLGNKTQLTARETMPSIASVIKPVNLDSSLFQIIDATKKLQALLQKFPADGSPMGETNLLMSNISFTLIKTIVVLCEDDLKQSKVMLLPEFVALWQHSIADCKVSMAEYAAKTGDQKAAKKHLSEATPHLQDVNAYFMDHHEIKYLHLGNMVTVTPKQQKEVIARHIAISKNKK